MADAKRDGNFVPTLLAVSNVDGVTPVVVYADPVTHRLLVDIAGGAGTVTDVSVVTANGFAGTVADSTTTPAITLTTTVTGILKGNGTAISAVTVGTGLAYDGTTLSATGVASSIVVGTTTITNGTDTRILYDNAGVVGEYTLTGSGTVVAMQTAPTFVTSITSPVINLSATSNQLVLQSTGVTGTLTWTPTSSNKTITFPDATGTVALTSDITGFANTALSNLASVAINTSLVSDTDNTDALGSASIGWSDLYLGSGALIDFANGNAVITHSSAVLTVSTGDLRVTTAGTNTASVVTVGGTQTLTSKTLTSPTITTANLSGTQLLAEGASIGYDPAGSADGAYSGITMTGVAGYTQAFGDLVYLASADSRWEATDADSATTSDRLLGMVVVAGTDGNACTLLMQGTIRADAKFPALTIGSAVYVGEAAGEIQVAIPTGADNVIRRVGYALTADSIYFNPSMDSQITVA